MELWAIGRYDLKLSEEEFWWEITPREFDALLKRLDRDAWGHIRSAYICALLGNVFNPGMKLIMNDFMPGEKMRQKQTPEQMLKVVKFYQAYYDMKERNKKHGRR